MCTSVLFSTFPAVEPSVSNVRVSSPHTPCPCQQSLPVLSPGPWEPRGLLPVAVGLSGGHLVDVDPHTGPPCWLLLRACVACVSAPVLWLSHTPSFGVPPITATHVPRRAVSHNLSAIPRLRSRAVTWLKDSPGVCSLAGHPASDHTVLSVQRYLSDPSLDWEHSCSSLSLMTLTSG